MSSPAELDATAILKLYRKGALSPVEVARDAIARLERFNPTVNAFIAHDGEGALSAARAAEARWRKGEPAGALDGVLVTVKDNINAKGWPTRRGSHTSSPAPVAEDAPAVARMREAGAIILGKTTLPEFGWIGACHSPLAGITHNPWKRGRTTGGSSGGAAAAALLNLGSLHLGTDGAGSIRIPAAFTGVFGIKPTYGRVPVYPASPFTVLAHHGPLTRSVADAALMMNAISRPDARDNMAWNTEPPDFRAGIEGGVRNLRVAYSSRLGYVKTLDPDVEREAAKAARVFEELGAHVEEADPGFAEPLEMIRTLWGAVSAVVVDGFSAEQRARMDPDFLKLAADGRHYTLAQYLAAFQARAELAKAMTEFHTRYDLLLTPQMPTGAIEAGRVTPADGRFGEEWINWSPYTYPFNLTQQPAASVPCGFTAEGLPVGLQIVGPARADALVLRAARAYEAARPFKMLSEPRA